MLPPRFSGYSDSEAAYVSSNFSFDSVNFLKDYQEYPESPYSEIDD